MALKFVERSETCQSWPLYFKYSEFKKVFSYPGYSKCTVDGLTAKFPDRRIGFFCESFSISD